MAITQTSYPKSKIKILLLENISPAAVAELRASGYADIREIKGALSEAELCEAVKGVHLIGIRSKTQITKKVIDAADKLLAVGCFCIGVNQVDLAAATKKGVAVFNAPHANTRSVAELIIGLSVMLIRKIVDKNTAAHSGVWMKDSAGSFELRGKTLGIVGYGNIGSQVSNMAGAFGLPGVFYDIATKLPHGNAKQIRDVKELLKVSDIVTLHVPSDSTTWNMINAETIKSFKKGAILINHSRGDVVDLDAVAKALKTGKLAGAAIDVFPEEPEKNGDAFATVLQGLPNVILTPHIDGRGPGKHWP
ncbi:MAG TPA: phosphoglycerate dehydrogenase [Pyrinomonadaceae bacterium]|nr:phosphoglycerate dehydrogenase [Pyrinomonadaceae bacterium]